ncbi:hypothetical protein PINS_up023432 [Pythium insidiosum]|nr:hypothetical protein PINS_up023432 [Pythium insidiosum]
MKRRRVGRMPDVARAIGAAAALAAAAAASADAWTWTASPLLRSHRLLTLGDVDLPALLQQIGPLECPDATAQIVARLLNANAMLVQQCQTDSGYHLLKNKMELPEQEQTVKVCASPSCMDLLSGHHPRQAARVRVRRLQPAVRRRKLYSHPRRPREPPVSAEAERLWRSLHPQSGHQLPFRERDDPCERQDGAQA